MLSGASAAEALPAVADGVRLPPVLRRGDAFLVSEFALRVGERVHAGEVKAGFGASPDYDAPTRARGRMPHSSIRRTTTHLARGRKRPSRVGPPPGRWRVLRFGASLTGQTNGPALPDATGLEVDKLDGVRVAAYLDRHLGD